MNKSTISGMVSVIATIKLKRRYGRFFKDTEENVVFALYEDVNGYVHFKYCNYDADTYQMVSDEFFNVFCPIKD